MPANSTGGDLASLLRRRRHHIGLSQQALADLSTVSVRAIRDLESGRATRPRRDTVNLLADGLRVGAAERSALLAAVPGLGVPAGAENGEGRTSGSVPAAPSAMIGRAAELSVLRDLVTGARERLVAIVGVSGVGKTRLAIEFARELRAVEGRDVRWLEARAGEPVDARLIGDEIGSDEVLLVLDGVDTADSAYAGLIQLLNVCPRLQILLTTDDAYRAIGWKLVPLAPLPVPVEVVAAGSDQLDAVRLLDRHLRSAGAGATDPATRAAICRLADGVPATLELVGQWAAVLTLDRLVAELSRDPFALASWPTANGTVHDPGASLRRSFARLAPPARDLVTMAPAHPWSVTAASERTGRPLCEVAYDVHALLLHGQVRRIDTLAGPQFEVLRMAQRVARDYSPPDLHAVPGIGVERQGLVVTRLGPVATATARRDLPSIAEVS